MPLKLTPRQRLIVYEDLLEVVCKDPSVDKGMCQYLLFLSDKNKKLPEDWKRSWGSQKMSALPELNKFQPTSYFALFWAPLTKKGWETRIGWIEQAIIDVKKLIVKK